MSQGPPQSRLAGTVAIVTGGTSGIGRATCVALARRGALVTVVARTGSGLDKVVTEIARTESAQALPLALDVRSEDDMVEMARRTVARFGRIDALVACAGVARGEASRGRLVPHSVAQLPTAAWDEIVATNLRGVFLANRAVLPVMIGQGHGSIVNVSSARAGRFGLPYAAAYCASKFAVIGFSESIADEARHHGVRVQVVLPDVTDTPMLGEAAGPGNHLGAVLSPTRVADLILSLLHLPDDTVVLNPVIGRVGTTGRPVSLASESIAQ